MLLNAAPALTAAIREEDSRAAGWPTDASVSRVCPNFATDPETLLEREREGGLARL